MSPPATPKQAPPFSPPTPGPSTPSPPPAAHTDPALFPPIQPGGSLLVAYQVRNKPVLIVGGGNVRGPPSSRLPYRR